MLTIKNDLYIWRFCLAILFFIATCLVNLSYAQCDREAITAKYWQYRANLKHFVAVDRDSSGCVNDGIGQDDQDPCICSKAGYGLPGTSINMTANGSEDQQDRSGEPPTGPLGWDFRDKDCFEPTGNTHNVLDMGSETPHQMSWYWVTLATEYKLLKENNQEQEAQRTLEELFLGLQAYKRLDIQANCIAKKRYVELAETQENEVLCSNIYTWDEKDGSPTKHKNFDTFYHGCAFTPQTDGLSGFFLREDATQDLEPLLHDVSEDKWNIDAIKSDFSNSLAPPCSKPDWYNQACYLVHRQDFMSQDGVIDMMIGLAMIKKYIPDYAKVTTCDGEEFHPLQMAKDIAGAIVDRVSNSYLNRSYWPGGSLCLDKAAWFSLGEGGVFNSTIAGLRRACTFIDGIPRPTSSGGQFAFKAGLFLQTALTSNSNEVFWIRLKTVGWDMGDDPRRSLYESTVITEGMEILPLINNLLHPSVDGSDIGLNKQFFKDMLCGAPCGGPCSKEDDYDEARMTTRPGLPEFDCPNTTSWTGQRWEGGNSGGNRQFNGLDFMALYNLYLLYYPEERTAYFNPERPGGEISLGSGHIDGPDLLCPNQNNDPSNTGHYQLINVQPSTVQNLTWTASSNLTLLNTQGLGTDARVESTISAPQFIQAAFQKDHEVTQFYNGLPGYFDDHFVVHEYGTMTDVCDITYRKPIVSTLPGYGINYEFDHCHGIYKFHAVPTGPEVSSTTYTWEVVAHPFLTNGTYGTVILPTFNGKDPVFNQWQWLPGDQGGYVDIRLTVTNDCGTAYFQVWGKDYDCGQGRKVIVAPNPTTAGGQVVVNVTKDYVVTPAGLDVRFIRTSTGSVQSTQRIYQNGEFVSTASFPTGNYTVRVSLDDNTVLTTTMIVN